MASPSASDPQWKPKVTLVGGTGVGKSSLIRRYVHDEFDDHYLITLGTKVVKRVLELEFPEVGRVRVDLMLWDTMGEEFLRPTLYETVLGGAKGVLVVCDVTQPESLAPMKAWVDLARQIRADLPMHILVNKSDLTPSQEVVEEALTVGRREMAPCFVTSAKSGNNVVAAFEDLARRIVAGTYAQRDTGLDPVADQIVAHAATRERTVQDFLLLTRLAMSTLQGRIEMLVAQGRLRVVSLDIGPDGRPLIRYVAGAAPPASVAAVGANSPTRR